MIKRMDYMSTAMNAMIRGNNDFKITSIEVIRPEFQTIDIEELQYESSGCR